MSEDDNQDIVQNGRPVRKPLYIAGAVVGLLAVAGGVWWLTRDADAGAAVPAPRTVSFDKNETQPEMPAGQMVTIAADQVDKIGLKLDTVGEVMSSEAAESSATGVVQANAYKETPVISLLGGVVRSISGELGENVGKGQSVAVVFSDELAAAQSRFLALQTETETARQNYDRTSRLVKLSPVSNLELDQALAALKTAQAELEEFQKRFDRAGKLLEIGAISREEYDAETTKLKSARANVEQAKSRHERAVKVADINPEARSEFEAAAVKRRTAESDLAAARQRLLLYGLSSGRISSLRSPSQITSEMTVTAPVSGTITKRAVNQGEVVEANKELMLLTNLSSVWVIAQVYEKDIAGLRTGSGASVSSNSYPDRLFRGQVTYIDTNINPETRTAQVRVELENPGHVLKLGMYVNVSFGSTGMAERTMPAVPSAAVQNIGDKQIVFVATSKPNVFEAKHVTLGKETDGRFVVLNGLNVGDSIVSEGSFLLRAEMLKQNPQQH